MQNSKKIEGLLKVLTSSQIDFILIGGFAAVLHGCHYSTRDIDICISSSNEEVESLIKELQEINPRDLRNNKEKPLITEGVETIQLITDLGILDIVFRVPAIGTYYDLLKNSEEIEIFGSTCRLISLEDLIKSKKFLGRHRDLVVVEELESILEHRSKLS